MIFVLNVDLLFELFFVDFRFYFNIVYISRKLSVGLCINFVVNCYSCIYN